MNSESAHKKRNKPQDESKLTRNKQIKIRLTEAERELVKKTAANAHLSLAGYLVACARNKPIVLIEEGARLRSELIREGANLNYALYLANVARKKGEAVDWQSIQNTIAKVSANLDLFATLIKKWDADISIQVEQDKEMIL